MNGSFKNISSECFYLPKSRRRGLDLLVSLISVFTADPRHFPFELGDTELSRKQKCYGKTVFFVNTEQLVSFVLGFHFGFDLL